MEQPRLTTIYPGGEGNMVEAFQAVPKQGNNPNVNLGLDAASLDVFHYTGFLNFLFQQYFV